jgi:ubiquinone/menaquinone biosynthesis C-methylase UbiE
MCDNPNLEIPNYPRTSKYENFFDEPYHEIKSVLKNFIKDGSEILDVGVFEGNLEEYIETFVKHCTINCVDIEPLALEKLKQKKFNNNKIIVTNKDANNFLENAAEGSADVILINAALHEINDPQNQSAYLDSFLLRARKILKEAGKLIVGDYYYSKELSDEEVESYIAYQKATINHGDDREKFIMPDLLKHKAQEHGFSVEYSNDLRAVKTLDRRYYSIVFKKL